MDSTLDSPKVFPHTLLKADDGYFSLPGLLFDSSVLRPLLPARQLILKFAFEFLLNAKWGTCFRDGLIHPQTKAVRPSCTCQN